MPAAPGLGRGEHPPAAAHVPVRGLAGAVGASAADAGDPRHRTARTPRLRGGLVARLHGHSVGLEKRRVKDTLTCDR